MIRYPAPERDPVGFALWWILWALFVAEAVLAFFFLREPGPAAPASSGPLLEWLGLGPLVLSVAVRWYVLPRQTQRTAALISFIVGLSLAEGAIIFALFLASAQRDVVFGLGFAGLLQFLPLFARKFFA